MTYSETIIKKLIIIAVTADKHCDKSAQQRTNSTTSYYQTILWWQYVAQY